MQRRYASPLPFGTELELDADGLVAATPEGVETPEGAFVILGRPALDALPRPGADPEPAPEVAVPEVADAEEDPEVELNPDPEAETAEAPVAGIEDAILATFRPTPRPEDLDERRERQLYGGLTLEELRARRPPERPQSLQELAAASAAAQGTSELAVASSLLPRSRPASVEAAAIELRARGPAAGASTAALEEPQVAPPTVDLDIPSNATVSRSATVDNVINLREVNLIGVSGTPTNRRALVRLPSGRFLTVTVGDRIDGGRVAAIGPNSLQYIRNGRNITLEVPSG